MSNEPEQPWPNRSDTPWGAWPVILLILVYGYSNYLVDATLWSWSKLGPGSYGEVYVTLDEIHPVAMQNGLMLVAWMLVTIGAWLLLRRHHKSFRDVGLGLKGQPFFAYYLALCLGVCVYVYSQSHYVYSALYLVVAAPFIEELLFRGMLLPVLVRRTNAWRGAIVSGVFFALAGPGHYMQGAYAVVWLALMGVFWAHVYLASRKLWLNIFMHAMLNARWLLVMYYLT